MEDTLQAILVFSVLFIVLGYVIYSRMRDKRINQELQFKSRKRVEDYTKALVAAGDKFDKEGIPEISSDISLKKGETLHALFKGVNWNEYRKVRTGRVSGHGITGRVRLAKGLYYRYGTAQMVSESMDQLTTIDTGDAYFTNKGLLFRGSAGNKTLGYDKMLSIVPFADGFQIERDSGKNIFIPCSLSSQPEKAAAIAILWDQARN